MFGIIRSWFKRNFSDPQVASLALMLIVITSAIMVTGRLLSVVFAAVVVAYLLEGLVGMLERFKVPRLGAVFLVFLPFFFLLFVLSFSLLPLLYREVSQLFHDLPTMLIDGQKLLLGYTDSYPTLFNETVVKEFMVGLRSEAGKIGQRILTASITVLPGAIALLVYAVLLPMLVFFLLKDKAAILRWSGRFLPQDRQLTNRVWQDVDRQIGNYIRGKFLEILIVGSVSALTFRFFGLNYAILLGALVGLSVVIPYLGATLVTFPIVLIAYFQWGWGSPLAYLMIAYLLIQALDANVLVPLLFSEVVNLHPVAIIVAVLFFGGVWGAVGVFFAIPLATVVKSVLDAWPRQEGDASRPSEQQGQVEPGEEAHCKEAEVKPNI